MVQNTHRFFQEVTDRIHAGASTDQVLGLIYDRIREFVPCNRLSLALLDGDRLVVSALRSDGPVSIGEGYAGPIAGSSLEPILLRGEVRIINDLRLHAETKPPSPATLLMLKEGMLSSLTLPLIVEGRPVGVMFFSSRVAGTYDRGHEDFLKAVVGQMALAVRQAQLQEALREKTRHLDAILHHSDDAIVLVSMDGKVLTWNEGARKIFGYRSSEIVGEDFSTLLAPHETSVFEKERRSRSYESSYIARDGRVVAMRQTSTPIRDADGSQVGRLVLLRDVTHLKKMEQDMAKNQNLAAIGEMAATLSHELKNPLAGMSGALQVLADSIPEGDDRRPILREVLDLIGRMDNTVHDLLSFAKPLTPAREDVPVRDTLEEAWNIVARQPSAAIAKINLNCPAHLKASLDAQLIEQVWINLFQNAVEAMPAGGELQVRVRNGDRVHVEVQDSGSGVAPANLARLFQPFFSTKTRGTGLGLAISKKIVEAHGGTIALQSEPGRGTTVTVELPA